MPLTGQGERGEKAELSPAELLEQKLRTDFESDFLEPGVVLEIPRSHNPDQAMGSVSDIQSGVSQELRGAIKAGDEIYFLVDTSTRLNSTDYSKPEYVNGTFLARFNPDTTAQKVDYSRELAFEDLPTRRLNARIRRGGADVSVAMDADGVVGIADEGSNKWIEVFRQKTPTDADPDDPDEQPFQPKTLDLKGGSSWQLHTSQVVDSMDWRH